MACAVLSSVSLVYLTFIVYIPAKREITSGLLEVPVICTTTHMRETDQCEYIIVLFLMELSIKQGRIGLLSFPYLDNLARALYKNSRTIKNGEVF